MQNQVGVSSTATSGVSLVNYVLVSPAFLLEILGFTKLKFMLTFVDLQQIWSNIRGVGSSSHWGAGKVCKCIVYYFSGKKY